MSIYRVLTRVEHKALLEQAFVEHRTMHEQMGRHITRGLIADGYLVDRRTFGATIDDERRAELEEEVEAEFRRVCAKDET